MIGLYDSFSPSILTGKADSKRRRSGDYLGSSETAIMQQLQYEAVMLSEELKKQKLEAKRIEEENTLKQLEIFEETVVSLDILKEIKNSWQVIFIVLIIYCLSFIYLTSIHLYLTLYKLKTLLRSYRFKYC